MEADKLKNLREAQMRATAELRAEEQRLKSERMVAERLLRKTLIDVVEYLSKRLRHSEWSAHSMSKDRMEAVAGIVFSKRRYVRAEEIMLPNGEPNYKRLDEILKELN